MSSFKDNQNGGPSKGGIACSWEELYEELGDLSFTLSSAPAAV